MGFRIGPPWWPLLAVTAPAWLPWLALRHRTFVRRAEAARARNARRLGAARPLELPELRRLEVTVLVEERVRPGFLGDDGVALLLATEAGGLLVDVGYGPATPTLEHNARRLGFSWDALDGLLVTHFHGDHAGGLRAARTRSVALPGSLAPDRAGVPCYLPEPGRAPGFEPVPVEGPRPVAAGLGTTGPLGRSLFFLGPVEEQAVLVRLRGRGTVVVTGCGHPGLPLILEMARRLVPGPLHAVVGGLHFPITTGRGRYPGFQAQRLFGTGRPPWRPLTDDDLDRGIAALRGAGVERLLLSAHDTCDHAIGRFAAELDADVEVLRAGASLAL